MAENPRALREKVLSALKSLEVKTQILDSHTQSIAKLETQIGQLPNAISRRGKGKLPSHPIENLRANYHEQAKVVITLRNEKLVDNNVGESIKDSNLNENETEGIDMETKIEKKKSHTRRVGGGDQEKNRRVAEGDTDSCAAARAAKREKEKQLQDGHNLQQQI
ncbi:hypothetical protein M9H77_09192 [Catharanthus roseus]|uniref:Uncharacterized protein n=1 Tax=Catharanthus roseus TaxID=4058 RepID=A0ACC0C032_CATRO|nr:hypothetical protein M9H77_09192 [Catharanthus roseus]